MKSMRMIVAFAFIAGTTVAFAAERTIGQKGKVFSEAEVALKKGETLVFVNDDNIPHNVLSTTPGHQFNMGLIGPGNATPVTFDKAGNIQIFCAMHPTMKMVVKVTD